MTTLMGQEKQRISERLERLDAEREKLSAQLNELEMAERVLARFAEKALTTGKRARARPAKTAPAAGEKRRARGNQQTPGVSLSDATLKAVQAHNEGATASEVLNYLSREFGMTIRPNHLGMALQRHRRAGRLDNRNQRWHLPPS
jgi:transposase